MSTKQTSTLLFAQDRDSSSLYLSDIFRIKTPNTYFNHLKTEFQFLGLEKEIDIMSSKKLVGVFIISVLILEAVNVYGVNGLSMDYYKINNKCPYVEAIVRNSVDKALQADPTLAAGLVRMLFHDCFIGGCDASVLLDSTANNTAEKASIANLSLRGYEVIDDAKQELEKRCPGVVSCTDIIVMAARDAVSLAGGPTYKVLKGRKDGYRSKKEDMNTGPPPTLNASGLISSFRKRGLTARDMVALSGAHTLGVARCSSFKVRLSNNDPTLDPSWAKNLSKTCNGGDNAERSFDSTRNSFDNNYFIALRTKTGVLFSDQTLFNTRRTRNIVISYAMNKSAFFFDFQKAMIKLSLLSAKQGNQGDVRLNCRVLN